MGKKIGKNKIKNLSGKYGQKLLDHAKQFATDSVKTVSKRAILAASGIRSSQEFYWKENY